MKRAYPIDTTPWPTLLPQETKAVPSPEPITAHSSAAAADGGSYAFVSPEVAALHNRAADSHCCNPFHFHPPWKQRKTKSVKSMPSIQTTPRIETTTTRTGKATPNGTTTTTITTTTTTTITQTQTQIHDTDGADCAAKQADMEAAGIKLHQLEQQQQRLQQQLQKQGQRQRRQKQQQHQHQQHQHETIKPDNAYSLETVTDGERLLANELLSLTIQDREIVYDDIHGAAAEANKTQRKEDDPAYLQAQFQKLEDELQTIRKKDAYNKAAFLSPYAVKNRMLLLKMLQAARWDIKVAAQSTAKYFQVKLELFGEHGFVRPIRWDDLDADAKWILQNSAIMRHEAVTRDINERSVLIFNFARFPIYCSVRSVLKALWYINATVPIKSLTSQKNGLITITNTINAAPKQIFNFLQALKELGKWGFTNSMPLRMTSNHLCFGETAMKPYISLLLLAVSQDMRIRTKFHFGSPLECMYELKTYGVPSHLLDSLDVTNNVQPQHHDDPHLYDAESQQQETKVGDLPDCHYNDHGVGLPDISPSASLTASSQSCHPNKHVYEHEDVDENKAESECRPQPSQMTHSAQQQQFPPYLVKIHDYEADLWNEYMKSKPSGTMFRPGPTDVVLGRGWPYQSYCGNVAFMEHLETQVPIYDRAQGKMERTKVTSAIAEQVQQRVRFLKRDGLFWKQVPDTASRQKISMSLRNLARRSTEVDK